MLYIYIQNILYYTCNIYILYVYINIYNRVTVVFIIRNGLFSTVSRFPWQKIYSSKKNTPTFSDV